MENYYKLFIFPILIIQILFGCAESSGDSGASTNTEYSSTSENDSNNNTSNEVTSNKPQAIGQDIKIYFNEKAQIKLTKKTKYSGSVKYLISKQPKNGSLSGTAPNLRYTPHSGFVGKDQFLFRVTQRTWSSEESKYVTRESDSAVIKINVVPHDTAPVAQALASGINSITIKWQKIYGATSYKIYRGNSSGATFQTVLKAGVTGTSFTDSGLAPTTEYHYRVSAMRHSFDSKQSKTASAFTSQPLLETISYNFDEGLPEHWSADKNWKAKSPRTGNSSIGFDGLNSGSTSMITQSFQVPSYGANLSFWHRFKKPINYKIDWSLDGKNNWRNLNHQIIKSEKLVRDTLSRPYYSYRYYSGGYYESYTKTKNYNIPQGASDISITVTGVKSCTYGYRKIYVNNYSYDFGTFTIPKSQLRYANGQLKIRIYEYCSSNAGSYDLEIKYSGTGMKDDEPISNWEKLTISLDSAKGKTVHFRFSAINNYIDTAWNIDDLTLTPNPVPIPKSSITVVDKHTLVVSWDSITEGMGYDLYRSESENGNYELIASSIKKNSYWDKNLKAHTKYYYKVQASYSNIKSPLSSVVNAFTIPPPPSGSRAIPISSKYVLVLWNLVKGVENYDLYRSSSLNGKFELLKSNLNSLGYNDETVTCEKNFYYKVKSFSNGKQSEFSPLATATTPSAIPSTPTNLVSELNNEGKRIKLTWGATDCGKSYKIYRSTNASNFEQISTTNNLEFTDRSLEGGKKYSYKVAGVSQTGEGALSAETKSLLSAPFHPESLVYNHIDSNYISLRWNKVDTATKYRIYFSENEANGFREFGSTSYQNLVLSKLKSDTVYYIKVSAENLGGESELSEPISARTLPPPPTGVKVKALNTTSLLIQWDLLKGASSYNIYRVQETKYCYGDWRSCKYKIIASNWESTTYADMNLEKDTVYYYKIHGVFRNTVEGVQSKIIKGRGQFSAPESVRFSNLTTNSVTLSWDPGEGAFSYNLYRDGKQLWVNFSPYHSCGKIIYNNCIIRDTTFTDTQNLVAGHRYNYTVSVESASGEGVKTRPLEVIIPRSKPY